MVTLSVLLIGALFASAGAAEPDPGPISYDNLPPGWQWPPTQAMQLAGERCMQDLRLAGVVFEPRSRSSGKAPRNGKIATPVVVPSMEFGGLQVRQVFGDRAPVMDCHMALALVRHARTLEVHGVRGLVAAGFYQNRRARLAGRTLPILSRHALGLAVDVRGVVTDAGQTLWVQDYHREPLFRRIEEALISGGQLRAVVTPGNDRAHKNHFHISATMMIDGQQPDRSVGVQEILELVSSP